MDSLSLCFCKFRHERLRLLLKISVLSEYLKEVLSLVFIIKEIANSTFEIVFCHFLISKVYIVFVLFAPLCCNAIIVMTNIYDNFTDKVKLEKYYSMKKITTVVWLVESVIVCVWLSVFNMPKSITIPVNFVDAFGILIEVIMLRIVNLCYINQDLPINNNGPSMGSTIIITQGDASNQLNNESIAVATEVIEKIGYENCNITQYHKETKPNKTYDFTVVKFSSIRKSANNPSIHPET
ncbi:hypothetical protein SteCoe_26780 [Stentor coeruleus]|uniref:Uncharacterized protein n=1 Tax=Stentor coeruleus TaxID=5963 RepID=A0A1R2BCF6_9CILI|nr:hypothetical protein SteCoe_26780 [Stentor coeruleus]